MISETFEFWQFFQCNIQLCSGSIVLDIFQLVVFLRSKYVLRVFHKIKESDSVGTITQNSLGLNDFSIFHFNSDWFLIGIILDLTDLGVDPNLGAIRPSAVSKNF